MQMDNACACLLSCIIIRNLWVTQLVAIGLVILVVLNCTNILTECNTGHHSAELMNRALLPLFESSILATNDYYSMYHNQIAILCMYVSHLGMQHFLTLDTPLLIYFSSHAYTDNKERCSWKLLW